MGMVVQRTWKVSCSPLESAVFLHAKYFLRKMVLNLPFLEDFRCVKCFESILHVGLSGGNRYCIYLSKRWLSGAAYLESFSACFLHVLAESHSPRLILIF